MLRLELFREVNHIYLKLFQDATDEAYVSHSLKISDTHLNQIRLGMKSIRYQDSLVELGKDIFRIIEPIASKLDGNQEQDLLLFLDRKLVWVPWELAYSGNSFLCEKFKVGRIIAGNESVANGNSRDIQEPCRILVIADPEGNSIRAQDEGKKISQQINAVANSSVDFLAGPITNAQVLDQLSRKYNVVLYVGNSIYTPGNPSQTGWILSNEQFFSISDIENLANQSPKLIISSHGQQVIAWSDEGGGASSQVEQGHSDEYENAVFVSYAWGEESESLVDQLEQVFAKQGIYVTRDKKDIDYKESIGDFERRLGRGQCIILVISDKYLRSEHCMYELGEVNKNRNLRNRIFPIVLADARIYRSVDRLAYFNHWDEQIEQLKQAIKQTDVINMTSITANLNKLAGIRASFDHLTETLGDMNTLYPDRHKVEGFSTLINKVKSAMQHVVLPNSVPQNRSVNHGILDNPSRQLRRQSDFNGGATLEIQETLAAQFDESALKDLCIFRLNYEYEGLEARSKEGKIKMLVNMMEKQARTAELVAAIQEMRPNIRFSFEWNECEAVYSLPEAFLRAGASHYIDIQQQSGNEELVVTSITELVNGLLLEDSTGKVVQSYLKRMIKDPAGQEWAGCTLYGYPQDGLLYTHAANQDEMQSLIHNKLLSAQISEDKGDWTEAERLYEEAKSLAGVNRKSLQQEIESRLGSFRKLIGDIQRTAESIKQNKATAESFLQQIGPYKLQRKLGSDQYQTLYVAESFNGDVAISNVVVGIPYEQDAVSQVNDYRRLTLLNHPNLARMLDCRQDLDIFYVVYEQLESPRSLANLLRDNRAQNTTVSERQCVQYLIQICQALEYAQLFGFLHGNLNPEKILITPENQIKVRDIGIAQIQEKRESVWAGYAAPERLRLNALRTSVDIWAVGILAYQMLTGVLPFGEQDNDVQQIYQKINEERPVDPSLLLPNISEGLSSIVLKALDRQKRYENYRDLLRDLQRTLDGKPLIIPLEEKLHLYLRAGYPLISILVEEEDRAESLINRIGILEKTPVYTWTAFQGLAGSKKLAGRFAAQPEEVLNWLTNHRERSLLVLKDFHSYLNDSLLQSAINSMYPFLRQSKSAAIFVSTHISVPEILSKKMVIFNMDTPDLAEIHALIDTAKTEDELFSPENLTLELENEFAWQAHGMTALDIEMVLRKSSIKHAGLRTNVLDDLLEYKGQVVQRGGLLELIQPDITFDNMGGMELLRDHVRRVGKALKTGNWLPLPKGWLFLGVPGCGKSLAAKALAGEWKMPLLRFDISRIYGAYLGQAEENLQEALQTAERISPCILWIDEIEKGLAGTESSGVGGTMQRVYSILLDWLQNRKSPVFVVATANFSGLPSHQLGKAGQKDVKTPASTLISRSPELFRAGRFDDIFFFDLPNAEARLQILEIFLQKYECIPPDVDWGALVQASDGATPVEMEQALVAAMFQAHTNKQTQLSNKGFEQELLAARYFSQNRVDEIDMIREIGKTALSRPVSNY